MGKKYKTSTLLKYEIKERIQLKKSRPMYRFSILFAIERPCQNGILRVSHI